MCARSWSLCAFVCWHEHCAVPPLGDYSTLLPTGKQRLPRNSVCPLRPWHSRGTDTQNGLDGVKRVECAERKPQNKDGQFVELRLPASQAEISRNLPFAPHATPDHLLRRGVMLLCHIHLPSRWFRRREICLVSIHSSFSAASALICRPCICASSACNGATASRSLTCNE